MKEKFEGVAIKFDTVEQRDHLYELAKEAGLDIDLCRTYNNGYFKEADEGAFYGDYDSPNDLPVVTYADFVARLPKDKIAALWLKHIVMYEDDEQLETLKNMAEYCGVYQQLIVSHLRNANWYRKYAHIQPSHISGVVINFSSFMDKAKKYGWVNTTEKAVMFPNEPKQIKNDLAAPISAIESSMVNPQHNEGDAFIRTATPTATPADAVYDFIKSQGLSYELGNAVNFICKANKGKKQALYNAKWYIEKAIEHETKTN